MPHNTEQTNRRAQRRPAENASAARSAGALNGILPLGLKLFTSPARPILFGLPALILKEFFFPLLPVFLRRDHRSIIAHDRVFSRLWSAKRGCYTLF